MTRRFPGSLALVLLALPCAGAQELAQVADTWRVEGVNPSGERYQGQAEISREGLIRLDVAHDDPALAGIWEGRLEPEPGGTFRGQLTKTAAGMAQQLGASGGALRLSSVLSLSERGDVLGGQVMLETDEGPRSLGRQELRRGSSLDLDGDDLLVVDGGELKGLTGSTQGAAHRLDLTFGVKRHAHLAVGLTRPRVLPHEEQSELQRQTLADASHPNNRATYWVTAQVEGAPRVAHKASVPIGPVKASVGFEAGAELKYRVTEHCTPPAGVSDPAEALNATSRWAFDLPLTAARALAKSPGAELVLEGAGTLAIRGSLSVGTSSTLTVDGKDVVRTGATVRAGGFYEVQGYLRLQLQRLAASQVRLRVTQGKQQRHGVFAEAFVGAYVPKETQAAFTPSVAYLDERLAKSAQGAVAGTSARAEKELLRIGFKQEQQRSTLEELDLSYRFDLARPTARTAYEAAVRGDLTQAAAAADDPESGVVQERRVWKAEQQVHDASELQISAVRGSEERTVTTTELVVDEEDGTTSAYSIYDYEHLWSFGPLGREKTISARVVRMREGDDLPATVRERSFTYHYVHHDPISTRAEVDHFLAAAIRFGMPGAQAKAQALQSNRPGSGLTSQFRGLYGTTRRIVELEVSDAGIRAILQAGPERLMQAYANASERLTGVAPIWVSPGRRRMLDSVKDHQLDDWYGSDANLRESKEQLASARVFVESMLGLATAATDQERARHLTLVADAAGFGLEVAGALVELAPPETVRIRAAIEGSKVSFETELSGRASKLVLPDLGR